MEHEERLKILDRKLKVSSERINRYDRSQGGLFMETKSELMEKIHEQQAIKKVVGSL